MTIKIKTRIETCRGTLQRGLPLKLKCYLKSLLANEYICDSYMKTDWLTALTFYRAPSQVIIYLPTKFERNWLRKDGKVIFLISSDLYNRPCHFTYGAVILTVLSTHHELSINQIILRLNEKWLRNQWPRPFYIISPFDLDLWPLALKLESPDLLVKGYWSIKFEKDRIRNDRDSQ